MLERKITAVGEVTMSLVVGPLRLVWHTSRDQVGFYRRKCEQVSSKLDGKKDTHPRR